jgi:tetratricopeptide (TPR) repeat protein
MALTPRSRRRLAIFFTITGVLAAGLIAVYVVSERRDDAATRAGLAEGLAAYQEERYYDALHKVGRYIQRFGDEADAVDDHTRYVYGVSRLNVETHNGSHIPAAMSAFREVSDNDIHHVGARTKLIELYLALGQHTEAQTLAERVIAVDPQDPVAWRALALSHYALRDFEQALQASEQLNELEPDNVAGWTITLSILRDRGDRESEIIDYARQRVEDSEGSLATQMMLSNALILHGRIEEAIAVIRSLESFAFADAASALQVVRQFEKLGGASVDGELIRTAMTLAQQADERFDDPGLREWLTVRRLAEGDLETVLATTREIEQEPRWKREGTSLAPLRALALIERGDDEGLDALQAKMADDDRRRLRRWAELIERVRDRDDATGAQLVEAASRVLEADPGHPYAMLWLAQGQIRQQKIDEAIETLREIVQAVPSWGGPRVAHIRLLMEADRHADAAVHARRATQLFNRSEQFAVLYFQSASRAMQGRPAAMQSSLLANVRKTRELFLPERAELKLIEIELLARLGREDEARAAAQAAIDAGLDDAMLVELAAVNGRTDLDLTPELDRVIDARQGSAPLVMLRADRLRQEGKTDQAVALLEASLADAGDTHQPAYLIALARMLERDDRDAALQRWQTASDRFPANLSVQRALLASPLVWSEASLSREAVERLKAQVGESNGWKQARARWLLRHGQSRPDYALAADLLGQVLRSDPEDAASHRLLADATMRLGNLELAESSLRQAALLQEDPGVVLQLAELATRRSDLPAARDYLRQIESMSLNQEQRLAAAQLYRRVGEPDKSLAVLDASVEIEDDADRLTAALMKAEALLSLGRSGEALDLVRPWRDRRDPRVWGVQARALGQADDQAGLTELRDRIARPDASADDRVMLAFVDLLMDQRSLALENYRQAHRADPTHERALAGLLRLLIRDGAHDEALRVADAAKAVDDAPAVAATVAQLLELHRASQDPALRSLAIAATGSEASSQAILEIARVLRESDASLREPDAALVREIGGVAQSHPGDPLIQSIHARSMLAIGRHDDALRIADAIIANHPNQASAYALSAEVLMAMGRYRDVLDAVTRWRELRTDDAADLDAISAMATLELGDPEQAVARLAEHEAEMLASMSPNDAGLRLYIRALAQSGKLDRVRALLEPRLDDAATARQLWADSGGDHLDSVEQAKAWIDRLERATPADDVVGKTQLVMMQRKLGLRLGSEALIHGSRARAVALASSGDLPSGVWRQLGIEAELLGDFDRAEQCYRRGFDPSRKTALIANNLAMILVREGQGEEAIGFASSAVAWAFEVPPLRPYRAEFLDTLAYAYLAADRGADAIRPLERAIEADPNNPEWPLHLAEVHDQLGDAEARDRLLTTLDRKTLSGEQLPADLRMRFEDLRRRSPSLSDAVLGTTTD